MDEESVPLYSNGPTKGQAAEVDVASFASQPTESNVSFKKVVAFSGPLALSEFVQRVSRPVRDSAGSGVLSAALASHYCASHSCVWFFSTELWRFLRLLMEYVHSLEGLKLWPCWGWCTRLVTCHTGKKSCGTCMRFLEFTIRRVTCDMYNAHSCP